MKIIKILLLSLIVFLVGMNGSSKKAFLNSLKGEIVYLNREKGSVNIYKISANGKNRQLLYRGALNCSRPIWSEDGSKIYFTTGKNEEWITLVMDSGGANVKIAENKKPDYVSRVSREEDIVVMRGSIYYIDKGKRVKVYNHKKYCSDLNSGAHEVSWSPDKKFIVFEKFKGTFLYFFGWSSGGIYIINREGTEMAKITEGRQPDWKY